MGLNCYPTLYPDDGEVLVEDLVVTDDTLVKIFALGPGASVEPHTHPNETNVFHVLEGEVTVLQGDSEELIDAPGVVVHERDVPHGARNDSDQIGVFTASLSPFPT
jgi:quercetin dioxygenase-like cupin family protein